MLTHRRMLASVVLLLGVLPFALAADSKDISCQETGQYIGGIDRHWSLTIGGPKDKTWAYTFRHLPAGAVDQGDFKTGGTYELTGDLTIFTGKHAGKDIRFGLNYGFPAGKVEFNGFFPAGEQSLKCHRQWFRQVEGKWELALELTLTMPAVGPDGDQWVVPLKGEYLRRDAAGKEQRTKIEERLTYIKLEGSPQYRLHRPQGRIPFTLLPQVKNKQLLAALTTAEGHSPFGYVRGFNPVLAELLDK